MGDRSMVGNRFSDLRLTLGVIQKAMSRGDVLAMIDAFALSLLARSKAPEANLLEQLAQSLQDARYELECRMDAEARGKENGSVTADYGDSPARRRPQ